MRFQSITITAIAALSSIAYAQDASQIAALSSDVLAYVTGTLILQPGFEGFLEAIETDSSLSQLAALTADPAFITQGPAALSSLVAEVPVTLQPFVQSILGVVSSIAIKDGVLSTTGGAAVAASTGAAGSAGSAASTTPSGTSSSSASKASATGSGANQLEMGIVAGALMGVVGLMAAL